MLKTMFSVNAKEAKKSGESISFSEHDESDKWRIYRNW